jgi:folylpolyglutamate synthase/dihydropteroate synthase
LPVETLNGYAEAHLNPQNLHAAESVAEAFDRARGLALGDPSSLVLVTGSISLVADVLKLQSENEDDDA